MQFSLYRRIRCFLSAQDAQSTLPVPNPLLQAATLCFTFTVRITPFPPIIALSPTISILAVLISISSLLVPTLITDSVRCVVFGAEKVYFLHLAISALLRATFLVFFVARWCFEGVFPVVVITLLVFGRLVRYHLLFTRIITMLSY